MRDQLKIQIIKAPELEILTFKGGLIIKLSPLYRLLLHTVHETQLLKALTQQPYILCPSTISSFCITYQLTVTNLAPNAPSFIKLAMNPYLWHLPYCHPPSKHQILQLLPLLKQLARFFLSAAAEAAATAARISAAAITTGKYIV